MGGLGRALLCPFSGGGGAPSRQVQGGRETIGRDHIMNDAMVDRSVITCPRCGTAKAETMPANACRSFYECTGCGAMLRPKQGDCCVFCSYGSVPCPPMQAERSGERGS